MATGASRVVLGSALVAVLGLGFAWWTVGARTPGARAGDSPSILFSTEPGLRSLRDLLHDDSLVPRLESLLRDQPILRIHSDERPEAGEFTHFFEFAPRTRRTSRVMQMVVDTREGAAGVFEFSETEIRWRTMPLGRLDPLLADGAALYFFRSMLDDPETFEALLVALGQDPPISVSDVFFPSDGSAGEDGAVPEDLTVAERVVAYFTFVQTSGYDFTPLYVVETPGGETRLVIPAWLERLK